MAGQIERSLFLLYLCLLVWAPLPFGSNRIWGGALLAALLSLILAGWLLLYLAGKVQLDAGVWRRARLPLGILLVVQFWVFLQMQLLPPSVVALLSPQASAWHINEEWLSFSLDPEFTRYYLVRGCGFTAAFFLSLALLNTPVRIERMLQVLVFSGTLQAVFGTYMVLSGLELGFFVEKYGGRGSVTGTFVNRNHMAGYLVMCLSAGIGLLLSRLTVARSSASWRERTRNWLGLLLSPTIRLRIYLALMVVALVLTQARMGNVAFFVALALASAVAIYSGRRFSLRGAAIIASFFLVDMLILGRWFGADKLLLRVEQTSLDVQERWWVLDSSIDYIKAFPIAGSGGGSFYGVFPNFQSARLEGFYGHAHNDYLEFAAELGLPVATLLSGFVMMALWHAYQTQRQRRTPLYTGAAFAVIMTCLWAAMHSLTDFNLQIPANALTFITILSLAYTCRSLPRPRC